MHLVMFDIDGTLIDSNGFDGDLYAQALREIIGIEVDRTWQSYRYVTDSGILKEVLDQCAPGIDTERVASSIKNRFVVLAIATGGWRETAELKLAKVAIDIQRIPLATSSEAEARIDIMKLAEQRAGPSGQFRFGDAPWDLKASAELGYCSVGVGMKCRAPG